MSEHYYNMTQNDYEYQDRIRKEIKCCENCEFMESERKFIFYKYRCNHDNHKFDISCQEIDTCLCKDFKNKHKQDDRGCGFRRR